jgi:hypothetical protein
VTAAARSRFPELWGLIPYATAAAGFGLLASFISLPVFAALVAVLGAWLVVVLVNYRVKSGAWHPTLMLLVVLSAASISWPGIQPTGFPPSDLLIGVAFLIVIALAIQGTLDVPIPAWLLGAAAALFAAELVVELFVPEPPPDPPPVFSPPGNPLALLFKVEFAMVIVPIVIAAVASSWRRANLITNLWLLSASVSAAVASIDFATGAGIGEALTGVSAGDRQVGLAYHPNHLALTSAMAIPIALLRAAEWRGRRQVLSIGATGLLITAVLASGSRVGILGAFVGIVLTASLIARLRSRIFVATVTVLVVLASVTALAPGGGSLFFGLDRLTGTPDAQRSDDQRVQQLHESIDIALDHPVTGVGFETIEGAHSVPVQFWESAGFLGVTGFAAYILGTMGLGLRIRRDARLPRGAPSLAGALMISFAVFLIAGLAQSPVADRFIYMPVGLLLGLGLVAKAATPGVRHPLPRTDALAQTEAEPPVERKPAPVIS